MKSWLLCLVPLALAGCSSGGGSGAAAKRPSLPAAEFKAGEELQVMPFKVGNSWTYTYEQQAQTVGNRANSVRQSVTWKIIKTEPAADGGIRATIQTLTNEVPGDQQTWVANKQGIFQEAIQPSDGAKKGKKIEYRPLLPVVIFPFESGKETEYKGHGMLPAGVEGNMTAKVRCIGSQEVDTDMGRMSALAVESDTRFQVPLRVDGKMQSAQGGTANSAWFKPGLGLVRYRSEVAVGNVARGTTTLKLKSTNVK